MLILPCYLSMSIPTVSPSWRVTSSHFSFLLPGCSHNAIPRQAGSTGFTSAGNKLGISPLHPLPGRPGPVLPMPPCPLSPGSLPSPPQSAQTQEAAHSRGIPELECPGLPAGATGEAGAVCSALHRDQSLRVLREIRPWE